MIRITAELEAKLYPVFRRVIFISFILLPAFIYAQVTGKELSKLSLPLRQKIQSASPGTESIFYITSKKIDSVYSLLQDNNVKILYGYKPSGVIVIRTTWKNIQMILANQQIDVVDIQRKPKEELALSNFDLSTNKVNIIH